MSDGSQRGKAEGPAGTIRLERLLPLFLFLGRGGPQAASEHPPPPRPSGPTRRLSTGAGDSWAEKKEPGYWKAHEGRLQGAASGPPGPERHRARAGRAGVQPGRRQSGLGGAGGGHPEVSDDVMGEEDAHFAARGARREPQRLESPSRTCETERPAPAADVKKASKNHGSEHPCQQENVY